VHIAITKVDQPSGDLLGGGGFREIRIPGMHVRQALRSPVIAGRALAGRDLRRTALTYVFERTTADMPFRRDRYTDSPQVELPENRQDPERQIGRVVFAPAARSYAVDAWVQPAVDAPDSAIDRLVGLRGPWRFDSSSRFQGEAGLRASSAFDGRADTAWLGTWTRPSDPYPWLAWTAPRTLTLSRLRLEMPRGPVRHPTLVQLSWAGGRTPPLRVAANGAVHLTSPARARSFRLTILRAGFPPGTTRRERATRAVGIASVTAPGVPTVHPQRAGGLRSRCGEVAVQAGGRRASLRVDGTIGDLLAGRPLRARGCSGPLRLGAGVQRVRSMPGGFSLDLLRLSSPAPQVAPAPAGGGRVVDAGRMRDNGIDGAHVRLTGPSWLVLGQSYNEGWQASCDGRSLGEPVPIDGYANGWRAPASCRDVDFSFAPQDSVRSSRLVSAVVCGLLLALLVLGRVLNGRATRAAAAPRAAGLWPDTRCGLALPRAAALALAATVPLSLLFALRTSVLIFPTLTFILWRGVGARALTAVAAALLGIAVPLAYATSSIENQGGYDFDYSTDVMRGHWLAVAALVLLMAACGRALRDTRRTRRPIEPPPQVDVADDQLSAVVAGDAAGVGRR
jgi:hypothetical protein